MTLDVRTELKSIRKEIFMLKVRQERLEDALLPEKDAQALAKARQDLEKGKTTKLSDIKKRLGI